MIRITLFGYGGMGKAIETAANSRTGISVSRIFDFTNEQGMQCIYGEDADIANEAVIDFSHFAMHDEAIKYALDKKIPIVVGTTGLSDSQIQNMKKASSEIPVLYSTNYSYGILIMKHIIREADKYLKEWDVELTETHHNRKKDAPSGTAKTLLSILNEDGSKIEVYGRKGITGEREKREIGVHALRGGTVAGTHTVSFFGNDETIEITHRASSRRIFAEGACIALEKLYGRQPGFYNLEEIVL